MIFKRLQPLWKDTNVVGEGTEPGEAVFRAWVLSIAMLVGPPLLLMIYYKVMFVGLTNPDSLDYAQLGRNLTMGRGFVTNLLRPIALTHGANPLAQPDVTNGPLFPLLLALAFGVSGAKDNTAAFVSGIFYVLTIPVLYFMGVRIFNRAVGLLAALIFAMNALLLEYATSGLPNTLYIFLMTCLLFCIYKISEARGETPEQDKRFPKGMYALTGLLTGLLYLTDPIFFWIVPLVVLAVIQLSPTRRGAALTMFCLPLGLVMLPWMARNMALTGNPVFGLRGIELWMGTKDYYPGATAYREYPSDLIHGVGIFRAVVQKLLLGAGTVIESFPRVTASWILAFFLPCLLFQFTDRATNAVRRIMMWCFCAIFVGSVAFHVDMPLFVAFMPTMLIFSLAYLMHLVEQAKLPRISIGWLTVLMVVGICYPLLSDMFLIEKTPALKERANAQALGKATRPDAVVLSDQPWIVAWYADRPAVWIPATDARVADMRRQFPQLQWLFLTEQVRGFSNEWLMVYDGFAHWTEDYVHALETAQTVPSLTINVPDKVKDKAPPLLVALTGFTAVAPGKDAAPTVIVAEASPPTQKIGLNAGPGDTQGH